MSASHATLPKKDASVTLTGIALCAAVAVSPLSLRVPIHTTGAGLVDFAMLCALGAGLPLIARATLGGDGQRLPRASLPFLGATMASALAAESMDVAVGEVVKVLLYAGAGSWLFLVCFNRGGWRERLGFALVLGLMVGCVGAALSVLDFDAWFRTWYGSPRLLFCSTTLLGGAALTLPLGLSRHMRAIAAVLFVVACVLLAWPQQRAKTAPPGTVPEHCLEGYAALSILADRPLLGVGPGNYQRSVGKYYQGMPKDNHLEPGQQIGFTVLLASQGLVGAASFLYWLYAPALGAWRSRRGTIAAIAFVGVLTAWGFATPLMTGRVLLPLALATGVLTGRASGCE